MLIRELQALCLDVELLKTRVPVPAALEPGAAEDQEEGASTEPSETAETETVPVLDEA